MFRILAIIGLTSLMTGCGTINILHNKIYYRNSLVPSVPVTTDKHPKDKVAVIVTRDYAKIQFRKEF